MKARLVLRAILPVVLLTVFASTAFAFEKAVYYDSRVDTNWWDATAAKATRDYFVGKGYTEVNGETSVDWMKARIADHARSVLVMAMDVCTDQMVAKADGTPDPNCVLRQYLNAGGKIVAVGDIPFYNHRNLTATARSSSGWGDAGAPAIISTPGSNGTRDANTVVAHTDAGKAWGLVATWKSQRPDTASSVNVVLSQYNTSNADAWARFLALSGPESAYVYLYDCTTGNLPAGKVDDGVLANIQAAAEYPPDGADPLPLGTLNGTVKDAGGNPVANTTIALTGPGGSTTLTSGADGTFSVQAAAGDYTATLSGEELDPTTQTAKITVTAGQSASATLSITTTPAFTIDKTNSTSLIGLTAKETDLTPTQPGFDDSTWKALDIAAKTTPTSPVVRAFWLRSKFDAPSGFALDKPAILYNVSVDDRCIGVWLNGVLLGSNRSGNSPGSMLIPGGTLKATGNVLAVLGWNTGGATGFNSALRIHSAQVNGVGHVRTVVVGTPMDKAGTAQDVRVGLVGADGKEIANKTSDVSGVVSFTQVPVGSYTVTFSGPVTDGTPSQAATVTAGAITESDTAALPAIDLGTVTGNIWKGKPKIDQTDLSMVAPSFDDSKWNPVPVPLDLKSADRGTLDTYGDNEWDAYRVHFTVPAEWKDANRYLVLDDFNVDDNDQTYMNGVLVGATSGYSIVRSYALPADLINFTGDNVLTIYWQNGTGGTGISDATRLVRLRQANNSQALIWGAVTGSDSKPVGAGVPVTIVAPDNTTSVTTTLAGGNYGLQTAKLGQNTVSAQGVSGSATPVAVGGQAIRADLSQDTTILSLNVDHGFTWKVYEGTQVTGDEPYFAVSADESKFVDYPVSDTVGDWTTMGPKDLTNNIYGWMRLTITPDQIPADWKTKAAGKDLILGGFNVDDVDETYVNGVKVGKTGTFPSDPQGFVNQWSAIRNYVVPGSVIDFSKPIVIAIKAYQGGGGAGFDSARPQLSVSGLTPPAVTKGDFKLNGAPDLEDVRLALRYFVYGLPLNAAQLSAVDFNGNGQFDLGDLILMLKQIVLAAVTP